jgi:hypothetical protein
MSKHFNVAVDPYDGGLTVCRGCKAQGTFTELPDGDCPRPYKPDSVLLAESLAREQALQQRLNAADQRIDEQASLIAELIVGWQEAEFGDPPTRLANAIKAARLTPQ